MDEVPQETLTLKYDYIVEICKLLKKCNDLLLLELIFKILRKNLI